MTTASTESNVLTVNGGSSSLKFAAYSDDVHPRLRLSGQIERIGLPDTQLLAQSADGNTLESRELPHSSCHRSAARELISLLCKWLTPGSIVGIGHRVTHAGLGATQQHRLVTADVIDHLKSHQSIAPLHIPPQVALIEAFVEGFAEVPQVACFDTAFHDPMPQIAKLLPIPRKYSDQGIQKYAYHGLSYEYLMQQLAEIADPDEARGRIILAHLGSGSSMAAVRGGLPVDSTMSFTPTAGLVMGTRPGDLDAGLVTYLMREQNMSVEDMDAMLNNECGLIGLSGGNCDMRDLLSRYETDTQASEALQAYCYQAQKHIGALAAVLGGLDTLVFSAGIGENIALIRQWICEPLGFLGLVLDTTRNENHQPVISSDASKIKVRVIPTDEQAIIVQIVRRIAQP